MKTQKKFDGTKLYTHKIPKRVRRAMKQFTQSDCYLVKRRRSGKTSEGKYRNCHTNVAYWVEHIGGESVDGWMLQREKGLLNNGWWSWAFHSVWKTPEGNLVDVTQNPLHEGKTHITFWKDKTRRVNLVDGISYNTVFVFANQRIAEHFSIQTNQRVQPSKVYWASMSNMMVKRVNEISGEFRLLTAEYPTNIKLLKDRTGLEIVDDNLFCPKHLREVETSADVLFDFCLSIEKRAA
jgi:hypothetical protein